MPNRKALYAGTFLVAASAVMLLAQSEPARDTVMDALALWPLAVIAIGVALIVRRTRLSLAAGLMAAVIPGLLLGGVVVAAPDVAAEFPGDCTVREPVTTITREGAFDGPARVALELNCGELGVTTNPGRSWTVDAGASGDVAPVITGTGTGLSVTSGGHGDRTGLPWGGDDIRVVLPTGQVLDLAVAVNAGRGDLNLDGARIGELRLDASAADVRLDLGGATVDRLGLDVNAARAVVLLPSGSDLTADLSINAAGATICAPAGLALRITEETVLGGSTFNGLVRNGSAWESPDYATATYRADMSVSVNVGSVDVNPVGGCK